MQQLIVKERTSRIELLKFLAKEYRELIGRKSVKYAQRQRLGYRFSKDFDADYPKLFKITKNANQAFPEFEESEIAHILSYLVNTTVNDELIDHMTSFVYSRSRKQMHYFKKTLIETHSKSFIPRHSWLMRFRQKSKLKWDVVNLINQKIYTVALTTKGKYCFYNILPSQGD